MAACTSATLATGTVGVVPGAEEPIDDAPGGHDAYIDIQADGATWRFERDFFASDWRCIYGEGCHGILPERSSDLAQGCCSYGAHLGDGDDGHTEAMNVAAYASTLTDAQWQHRDVMRTGGPGAVFADDLRTHTLVHDGACVFLNRPDFARGPGCALHVGAIDAGESPIDWKPSVCWQLPIRVEWEHDGIDEVATVRRWRRTDWGEFGTTMAWCCTERSDGGEAFGSGRRVADTLAAEIDALVGEPVAVELRRRLDD